MWSCQGRVRTRVRLQQGCNLGAGVWCRDFVLQGWALRLCCGLIQGSLKVVVFGNCREGTNSSFLNIFPCGERRDQICKGT